MAPKLPAGQQIKCITVDLITHMSNIQETRPGECRKGEGQRDRAGAAMLCGDAMRWAETCTIDSMLPNKALCS